MSFNALICQELFLLHSAVIIIFIDLNIMKAHSSWVFKHWYGCWDSQKLNVSLKISSVIGSVLRTLRVSTMESLKSLVKNLPTEDNIKYCSQKHRIIKMRVNLLVKTPNLLRTSAYKKVWIDLKKGDLWFPKARKAEHIYHINEFPQGKVVSSQLSMARKFSYVSSQRREPSYVQVCLPFSSSRNGSFCVFITSLCLWHCIKYLDNSSFTVC